MYGIIDCDNCYVSCERVFRPDLEGKPVVVLSNNDGCVVARSNEAKKMGIKAGTPYFQLAQQFPNQKIAVFSSNYELYGELTGRIVSLISQEVPAYFRYSIDECFVCLPDKAAANCHFVLAVAREPFGLRCPSPVPLLRPFVHLAVGQYVLAVGGEVLGL